MRLTAIQSRLDFSDHNPRSLYHIGTMDVCCHCVHVVPFEMKDIIVTASDNLLY